MRKCVGAVIMATIVIMATTVITGTTDIITADTIRPVKPEPDAVAL